MTPLVSAPGVVLKDSFTGWMNKSLTKKKTIFFSPCTRLSLPKHSTLTNHCVLFHINLSLFFLVKFVQIFGQVY